MKEREDYKQSENDREKTSRMKAKRKRTEGSSTKKTDSIMRAKKTEKEDYKR